MTFINMTRRVLLGSLSGAALLAASPTPAMAQDELIVVEQKRVTTYLNGGVGEDEAQYMRRTAKDWSLRLTFSESKDNEFVADVDLLITDLRGTPYLHLTGAGPMTYARLPAGKYRVTAQWKEKSETREVTLDGKVGRDVNFHWAAPAQ
jgi:hypothetical protein